MSTSTFDHFYRSPYHSVKIESYFRVYDHLFSSLKGRDDITFAEIGVLDGGSLHMWRSYFGKNARIIGIDMNEHAKKWNDHGFEIFIGDQTDPAFWENFYRKVGHVDILLDDGGHKYCQQISTVQNAFHHLRASSLIVVDDTGTSLMPEFGGPSEYSFLGYAKTLSDQLTARIALENTARFPTVYPIKEVIEKCFSIEFYTGIVAFRLDPCSIDRSRTMNNMPIASPEQDFRHAGLKSMEMEWPSLFQEHGQIKDVF